MSTLRLEKPERKIIEKNRRNQMKFLYSRLFSLIPPHGTSKGGDQVANQVDRAINYIQTLKTNLEVNKNKKDRLLLLLSKKRSHEDTEMINSVSIPLDIQIHEMTHDHDAVLVTGLKTYSTFCNVVQFLDQYSTEVTLANFSNSGHSTFHICQKKIDADDICKRLKDSVENMKEFGDTTHASFRNEVDLDLSVWDFDLLY
ncbi:putative transcription factor bHLH family [Helianthus annuus]|nr:putative transcription factor bHLH family [Helianthus annuus]